MFNCWAKVVLMWRLSNGIVGHVAVHVTYLMSELVRILLKWRTGHGDNEAMNVWSRASPHAPLLSSNDNRIRIPCPPLFQERH